MENFGKLESFSMGTINQLTEPTSSGKSVGGAALIPGSTRTLLTRTPPLEMLTPLLKEYVTSKERHPDAILLVNALWV